MYIWKCTYVYPITQKNGNNKEYRGTTFEPFKQTTLNVHIWIHKRLRRRQRFTRKCGIGLAGPVEKKRRRRNLLYPHPKLSLGLQCPIAISLYSKVDIASKKMTHQIIHMHHFVLVLTIEEYSYLVMPTTGPNVSSQFIRAFFGISVNKVGWKYQSAKSDSLWPPNTTLAPELVASLM